MYTGSEGDVWAALRRPDPPSHASPLSCLDAPCPSPEADLLDSDAHPEWVAVKVIPANSPCQRTYMQLEPLWPRLCAHPHVARVHEATSEFFSSASSTTAAPAVSPPTGVPQSPVGSAHSIHSPASSTSTHPCSGGSSDPHHPFFPTAHSGRYFLTQRLYDGDLHQAITFCNDSSAQGPLGFGEPLCARLFLQLASALAHCHALGVYHRDVKLENVFLDRQTRECFLGDFGEARVVTPHHHHRNISCGARDGASAQSAASISSAAVPTISTSVVVPAAACEIEPSSACSSEAGPLDAATAGSSSSRSSARDHTAREAELASLAAADVGGLGVVLYCMVTGHSPRRFHPHQGSAATSGDEKQGRSQLWTPSHLSPSLVNLLEQLLVADPLQRPSLEQVLHHPWLTLPKLSPSTATTLSSEEEVTAPQEEHHEESRQRAIPVAGPSMKRARVETRVEPRLTTASLGTKPLVEDDIEDEEEKDAEIASTRSHAPEPEEPSPRMRRAVTDESNLAAQERSQLSSSAASSRTETSRTEPKRRCVITIDAQEGPHP